MTETLLNEQNVYWILWLNTLLHELGVPVPMTPTATGRGRARRHSGCQSATAGSGDCCCDDAWQCSVVCGRPALWLRGVEALVSRFDLARHVRRAHRRHVRTLGMVGAGDRTIFTRCDAGCAAARGRARNGVEQISAADSRRLGALRCGRRRRLECCCTVRSRHCCSKSRCSAGKRREY